MNTADCTAAAREAIRNPDRYGITWVDCIILRWQHGFYGAFHMALFKTIELADPINLARLENAFPAEVHAFRLYKTTWIAERLRKKRLL